MKNLRERIGLKILRLIDRYIDSFEKRIFIFIIFITMYWLWQNIWQLLLFYKVYVITDYESLFNLQAHLSNYESSVLIRIIYYVISNPSLNMAGLVSCIKLIDIMGIVGLLILAQKYRIIMILNVFKYVWCTIWIVRCIFCKCIFGNKLFKMAFNRRFDSCWYSDSSMAFWLGTNNPRKR